MSFYWVSREEVFSVSDLIFLKKKFAFRNSTEIFFIWKIKSLVGMLFKDLRNSFKRDFFFLKNHQISHLKNIWENKRNIYFSPKKKDYRRDYLIYDKYSLYWPISFLREFKKSSYFLFPQLTLSRGFFIFYFDFSHINSVSSIYFSHDDFSKDRKQADYWNTWLIFSSLKNHIPFFLHESTSSYFEIKKYLIA